MSRRVRWRVRRHRGLVVDAPLLGRLQPGSSWLHRAGAGAKLVGVVAVGVATGLARWLLAPAPAALVLAGLAALLAGLALSAGLRPRYLAGQVRSLAWVLLALGVFQVWSNGPATAAAVLAGLVGCLWAAAALTATTPVPVLLDALARAARPLRRVGVDPEHVALTFSVALAGVPVVARLLAEAREAAAARGLRGDPRAVLVPAVVRTVAHAEAVAEALAARGLEHGPDDGGAEAPGGEAPGDAGPGREPGPSAAADGPGSGVLRFRR
ncbi:CbiQ family ECF transporter T component [Kineococcus arenarius]|uniref:CbiQ family ECF transporter T component n=1 Tax=Kineococcus sp. SYSU DK007 TaxID=3383128 RepID=UPI003D7D3D5B